MTTPQGNDPTQETYLSGTTARPDSLQGQGDAAKYGTDPTLDRMRDTGDQDEVAQQQLDAQQGTPGGQVPGVLASNDQNQGLLTDDEDADLDDADLDDAEDVDDMTAADMAGQGD